MLSRCLLIASLTLQGCPASLPRQPPPTKPLLEAYLAAPCLPFGLPAIENDYDSWQEWVETVVLPRAADCAIRHNKTVEAWPK